MHLIARLASAVLALSLALTIPALAADISNSTWSETDGSNNSASPNGWKSGTMLPSQVEPTARAMMGAIKRFYNHVNGTVTSGGTANAQTLTYSVAPAAYVAGDTYTFKVGASLTNTGAATLNINSLGAAAIQHSGAPLVAAELVAGTYATVVYDGTNFQLRHVPEGRSLLDFGCKGDGVTDDSACVTAALASGVRRLNLGDHMYALASGQTISNVAGVTFRGTQPYYSGSSSCVSGFLATTTNLSLFTLGSNVDGVVFEHLCINMGGGGTNTSGSAIVMSASSRGTLIRDVNISFPCIGIDVNGVSAVLDHVTVSQSSGSGCGSVRVGHLTAETLTPGTIDPYIINSTFQSNPTTHADYGIRIEDASGLYMENNENLQATTGTITIPGTNQQVTWLHGINTVLGDTTVSQANLIDTAAANALVFGWRCDNCWASSSTSSAGFAIGNTAGGTVAGIHTTDLTTLTNAQQGILINAGTDLDFISPHVCGNSASSAGTYDGITIASSVSHIKIIGGESGGTCLGRTGTQQSGILLNGSNADTLIEGMDLTKGNTTGLNTAGQPATAVFINNFGFNPRGPGSISVTSSPFTYTASFTTENVCLSGGTVSSVVVSGVTLLTGSNACVMLGPGQAVVVTYTGAPTMNTNRL